jgi:hypothetical protein
MTDPKLQQLPAEPRVSLAIDPDPEKTREWFRRLLADARAWAEREKDSEAA